MTDRQIIVVRRFLLRIADFVGKLSRRPVSKNSFAIFPDGGGAFHFEEEQRSPDDGDRHRQIEIISGDGNSLATSDVSR